MKLPFTLPPRFLFIGGGALGAFLLVVASFGLYRLASGVMLSGSIERVSPKPVSGEENQSDAGWIGRLAEQPTAAFAYPATELQIRLDLIQKLEEERVYRVVIGDLDEYKFFCINQVLNANAIQYSFYRTPHFIRLVITTESRSELNRVLEQLRDYGIEFSIEHHTRKG